MCVCVYLPSGRCIFISLITEGKCCRVCEQIIPNRIRFDSITFYKK